jgi:uncharacterized phage infection (PIP) family protein YhgE
LGGLFVTTSAWGQNHNSLDDVLARNHELQQEIRQRADSVTSLRNRMQQQLNQFNNQQVRCKQLQAQKQALSKDSLDSMEGFVKTLTERKDTLDNLIKTRQREIDDYRTAQRNIEDSLLRMTQYEELFTNGIYAQQRAYLTQRFSTMTLAQLDSMDASKERFCRKTDYAAYCAQLDTTRQHKSLYDAAYRAIATPYQYDSVQSVRNRILPFRNNPGLLPNLQYNELDSLDIKLSRYADGMLLLQQMVRHINDDNCVKAFRAGDTTKQSVYETTIDSYLNPQDEEGKNNIKRYFDLLPYLDRLRHDYESELRTSPDNLPTPCEKAIMKTVIQ